MTSVLDIDSLTGGYAGTQVLFEVSARIEAGAVLGVLGRNGVGKSTLARLVQGGLQPARGEIRFNGQSINQAQAHERRALGVGYMPQTGMVFDDLTVAENLYLGDNRVDPATYFERFPRLTERLHQPAGTLSGGERKLLAFVRAMSENTQLLVLDEPSEGVQPENIERMADCLTERAADRAGVLLCEQNLVFLMRVASRYLGLDTGRVVLDRAADQVSEAELRAVLSL
ncbi:MAG: ATP-binding cassette domain-containing protein [Pseudomonadota bacterium]